MKDILSRLKNVSKRLFSQNPERDWFLLFIVTLVLMVVSILWNMWFFAHIEEGSGVILQEGASLEAYSATRVHEIFDMRAAEASRYGTDYSFIDPSR
jgi:hypothetical protein